MENYRALLVCGNVKTD